MFNSQGTAAQKQFNTNCQVILFLYPWKWEGGVDIVWMLWIQSLAKTVCATVTLACNSTSVWKEVQPIWSFLAGYGLEKREAAAAGEYASPTVGSVGLGGSKTEAQQFKAICSRSLRQRGTEPVSWDSAIHSFNWIYDCPKTLITDLLQHPCGSFSLLRRF